MKNLLSIFIALLICNVLHGQTVPKYSWVVYDTNTVPANNGVSLKTDYNGNLYTIGNIENANGTSGIVMQVLNSYGKVIRSNILSYNSTECNISSTNINIDDTYIYVIGYYKGILNNNIAQNEDIFIFKYKLSSYGTDSFLWFNKYGDINNDRVYDITFDKSHNIYVTGSNGLNKVVISKLDYNGNFIKNKYLDGFSSDAGKSLVFNNYNELFVTGKLNNNTFIIKLDTALNMIDSLYAMSNIGNSNSGNTILFNSQLNEFILNGTYKGDNIFIFKNDTITIGNSISEGTYLISINSNFELIKTPIIENNHNFFNIALDINNNIYVIDSVFDSLSIIKIGKDFTKIWTKNIIFSNLDGQTLNANSILLYNNNIFITGSINTMQKNIIYDNIAIQTNSDILMYIAAITYLDCPSMSIDSLITTLITWNAIPNATAYDIHIYNSNYDTTITVSDVEYDITQLNLSNDSTYNVQVIATNPNINSSMGCDTFIISNPVSRQNISSIDFLIYPNPSDGNITLVLKNINEANVSITNQLGQVVYLKKINNSENIQLNVPTGIYFVKAYTNEKEYTKKLIIN